MTPTIRSNEDSGLPAVKNEEESTGMKIVLTRKEGAPVSSMWAFVIVEAISER